MHKDQTKRHPQKTREKQHQDISMGHKLTMKRETRIAACIYQTKDTHIMCLQDTHLDQESTFLAEGYELYRKDRSSRKGRGSAVLL